MKRRMIGWLTVVMCLTGLTAKGGGSSGGGGETSDISGTAWFTVPRPIWYCIDSDPGFGISDKDAQKAFEAAAKTWADYFKARMTSFHARFTKAPCDGRQDLTLYLGKETSEVADAKKKYMAPVAVAERTEYDFEDGWGKGFIWVAKSQEKLSEDTTAGDWSTPDRLEVLFTHEIGHTMGCDHVDGTIMDEGIPSYVSKARIGTTRPLSALKSIDQARELVPDFGPSGTLYTGKLGKKSRYSTNAATGEEAFELVSGRKPVGKVTGELLIGRYEKQKVEMKDEKGVFALALAFTDEVFFDIARVFRVSKANQHTWEQMAARNVEGTATDTSGKVYSFRLVQNSEHGLAEFALVVAGKKYPLFSAVE